MTTPDLPDILRSAVQELNGNPAALTDAVQRLPRTSGLYAWWAAREVFTDLPGPANGTDPSVRLLYIGIASNLHSRIARNHLARSGSSTLRRTLAGLLLPEEHYRTTWTDRVILVPADEQRLTAWMHDKLRLTWFACAQPRLHEISLITMLQPPLNVDGASPSDVRDRVKRAKAAYLASAGPPVRSATRSRD